MDSGYIMGPSELFTIFFVMVGPLEHLAPFAKVTRGMTQAQIDSLALKSTAMIIPIVVVLGLFGMQLLHEWHIPIPVLQLTAGIIFAIMAFRILLFSHKEEPLGGDDKQEVAPITMALKIIINPYVCGTLIVLLASSHDAQRMTLVFTMLIINLLLDGIALKFIRIFMGKAGQVFLQILGSVLGVMQAALAVTIIHFSLKMLQAS